MSTAAPPSRGRFPIYLIKPSHYDDDGYVIQWLRTTIPSNSLATVYGLVRDAAARQVLGPDCDIVCEAIDETNTRVNAERIIRTIRKHGRGLVALIGVQSNQFPRAMDLARQFRAAGVTVLLGGFHVSGSLSMLPGVQPDLQAAMDLGVTLVAGEIEGRIDTLLRDAADCTLKPLYNHLDDLPDLHGAATPFLPRPILVRSVGTQTSFDAGRGCPFKCSFCTIINVQGRKSRRRSVDDIEVIIRENASQGVTNYFITDDNFARNKEWEDVFDRLIALREEGLQITFTIQVDTMCHKLDGFIEKAARAGATKAFVGLENINPDALAGAQKFQNKIADYRAMMQAWHRVGVLVFAGYIIGFPNDTPETVVRDVRIIQRELPVDFLEFFYLTPLPGSQDHQALFEKGAWMDPDLNKYDLFHVTTTHPRMSQAAWEEAYQMAWKTYYTPAHIETLFRRAHASGIPLSRMLTMAVWFAGTVTIEHVHPLEGGYFRRKERRARRPGLKRESALAFYPRYWIETLAKHARFLKLIFQYRGIAARVMRDPEAIKYTDLAVSPLAQTDQTRLKLFAAPHAKAARLS